MWLPVQTWEKWAIAQLCTFTGSRDIQNCVLKTNGLNLACWTPNQAHLAQDKAGL